MLAKFGFNSPEKPTHGGEVRGCGIASSHRQLSNALLGEYVACREVRQPSVNQPQPLILPIKRLLLLSRLAACSPRRTASRHPAVSYALATLIAGPHGCIAKIFMPICTTLPHVPPGRPSFLRIPSRVRAACISPKVTVSGANPSIFKVKKKYRVQSKAELSPELLHPVFVLNFEN